jgi:hypothetical protein
MSVGYPIRSGGTRAWRPAEVGSLLTVLGLGEDRLSIYLNDHLAGATVGVNLARRAAGNNRSTSYGEVLSALAVEIEQDRRSLLELMERLSVGQDRLKVALSWGAERAARLKPNGALLRYSPLSRLEELEALALGVHGKLTLWQTLRRTHGADPRLRGIDFEELIDRARSQRRRLERQRTRAADEALEARR